MRGNLLLLESEVYMVTIVNPEKYVAGLYERLSNENIEVGDGEVIVSHDDERESGSISTQKIFLRNFCRDNNIEVFDDYTDDGYSGASFDRPDFNRMVQDIEKKKINLVIVKDLSRFGRVSNQISYYLEEFFIEKKVRFIAITDDIDTGSIETSEDMMQFKSFFNEWFLRDTSKKVRNGKKTRAREGKVMTTYPTYGYKKDVADKNHYVIDPDVAPIIRRIFSLAKSGMSPTKIGRILTSEKVLLPSEVVGNQHVRKNNTRRNWNRSTVKRILKNVTYLGWVSNGNLRKINYKSKKIITMPKEDRIIVKGMHTPIIDEETFNIVQEMLKSRTSVRTKNYDWLLKGLIVCKECGKKMGVISQRHAHKTTFYVRCNTYAGYSDLKLCKPHISNLEKTTDFVIAQVRKKCAEFLDADKEAKLSNRLKEDALKDKNNIKNELLILRKMVVDINKTIDKLFEDKYKGLFEDEDFRRVYTRQTESRKEIEDRIEQLEKMQEKQDGLVDINRLVSNFLNAKEITKDMLVSLIDRIEMSEKKQITIYYKFNILNVNNEAKRAS